MPFASLIFSLVRIMHVMAAQPVLLTNTSTTKINGSKYSSPWKVHFFQLAWAMSRQLLWEELKPQLFMLLRIILWCLLKQIVLQSNALLQINSMHMDQLLLTSGPFLFLVVK